MITLYFKICGFQIMDNKNKGWDKSIRYTVFDFENQSLCFHCEDYEML